MIECFVFAQLGRLCCLLMALFSREKSFQSQTQIISSVWEIIVCTVGQLKPFVIRNHWVI